MSSCVIVIFAILTLVGLHQPRTPLSMGFKKLATPAREIIGDGALLAGDKAAPYTIVEFADYECPACKALGPQAEGIAESSPMQVRLCFRNLPLTIHAHAYAASLAAEAARNQGRFREFHDALMSGYADQEACLDEAGHLNLDMSRFKADMRAARVRIANDIQSARSLSLDQTPTFILCTPGGEAFLVPDLDDISLFLATARNQ
jgi:Protein-disulfide isomerase